MIRSLTLIVICVLLISCGNKNSTKDLDVYVQELETAKTVSEKAGDVIKIIPPQAIVFKNQTNRSPFASDEVTKTKLRSTNPLQNYSLSVLQFKGTLIRDNETIAYILAPNKKLYELKVGDPIGNHYGKIINIYPDRVEVKEEVEEATASSKDVTERTVTLPLKEGSI